MFVRWKRRRLKSNAPWTCLPVCCEQEGDGREALTPLVVRSRRVDGRPRQEVVGRPGFTIRSCCTAEPVARCLFWRAVSLWFRNVAGFIGTDVETLRDAEISTNRTRLLASIVAVVPLPSDADIEVFTEHERQQG